MHNPRARFSKFAVWWALLLAHLLYSCASSAPDDERLGKMTQALCAEPDHQCPGNGACCAEDVFCCGSLCLPPGQDCCNNDVLCPSGKSCVDGVCCDSTCTGLCRRCGANGTCGFSAAGTDPDGDCTPIQNSCAVGANCNGTGACQPAASGTPCGATTCSGGSITGSVCNTVGTCVSSTTSCNPYLCADATACGNTCTSDMQCAANAFCRTSDHTCQPDKANGSGCASASQCTSGNCVDGVCCESACAGTCRACSAAKKGFGLDGFCETLASGSDPDGECPDDGSSSCDRNGFCDGNGACANYPLGTSCGSTTCSAGQQNGHACDGFGSCNPTNLTQCSPYTCSGDACATTCSSNSNCIGAAYCRTSDSSCQPDQGNGSSCTSGSQCSTGNCVDGVCCESACAGACQACSATKKGSGVDGVCGSVAADSDPDSECPDDGAVSCDRNGSCDGNGACAKYALGTSCGATTCSTGTQTGYSCDGFGECDPSNVTQCSPYTCSGTACATTCTTNTNCIASAYCRTSDGTCQPDQDNGSSCSSPSQCTSGNCVDGVCCDTACDGTCDACSASKKGSGADGACGAIEVGTDPDGECADEGANTCKKDGTCSGNHSCRLYENGVACGTTSCSAGTQTGFACNGLGTCNPSTTSSCSPYVCSDTIQCADSCASDTGCVSSSYCRASDHTCQPDQAKGATCTAASQCTSGNCVDGYCCDAPCSDLCQACSAAKTGGVNGTCKGITKGNDPDGECPDDGPSSCARNGVCEAAGLCQKYTSGTACGSTTCSMGMQAGYACDGAGTCKQNQSTSCDPYVCSGAACGDTCVSDADCVASAFCDNTSHCAADQANGAGCSKNSQCKNGNCVDGVCCDQPCAELCQACSAAKKGGGSDGVCGNVKAESDPDNDCSADAPTTCQSDGHCDGQGACKKYGLGTVCGATECSGSQLTGHQCNGLGACVDGQSSCMPYVCLTSSCSASCGDDNGCVAGTYCAGSTCEPKLGNGSPCSGNRECSSTFCVEGVCCDTACNGVCQACTAANKASGEDGACDLAKVGSDAHDDCPDDGALSCKRDGLCDGAGECRRYEAGTACGITRCEGNVQTGFACDGGGKCEANTTNDCKLYACMSGACTVTCLDSNDCSASAYCDVAQGTCQEKQENGSACDEPGTCASGYCVDAVCCDKACAGQCQACDVATAPGTCSPIVGVPHGIRPACDPGTAGDVCSARACDGEQDTNSCVGYVGADTSCRDQTCAEGIETFSAACNGAGECGPAGPVKTKKCEPYVCQGQGCGSAPCAGDMDCAPKFRCDPNKHDCVPKDVASCDGDHVISNPDGTTTECAPFKCEGSVCKDSCASVDDCVSGFVCDAASHCVAASGSTSSGAGCGCRVADGRPERTPLWLLLLGVSLAARRRWRRRPVTVLRA